MEEGCASLRQFLGIVGLEEHADAMEAEGVTCIDDLKLLTEERQLTELASSSAEARRAATLRTELEGTAQPPEP